MRMSDAGGDNTSHDALQGPSACNIYTMWGRAQTDMPQQTANLKFLALESLAWCKGTASACDCAGAWQCSTMLLSNPSTEYVSMSPCWLFDMSAAEMPSGNVLWSLSLWS